MNTYLVAKRDVKDFTIVDDDGNELTFSLKAGSKIKIHQWIETYDSEVWVKLFSDNDEPSCASAEDFRIEYEG